MPIHYVDLDGEKVSVAEYCRRKALKLYMVTNRVQRYKETYEQAIAYCETNLECYYESREKANLSEKDIEELQCFAKENNINSRTISVYIRNHPHMTVEDIKKYYMNKLHYSARTSPRFYGIWQNMMSRCYNESDCAYPNYGGRGIKVCEQWHDYRNFQDDLWNSYIKHCEEFGIKDTTFDRFPNVDGNYELNNTRWATRKEQSNNRRNTIKIDENNCFGDFCDDNDLDRRVIWQRFKKYGWTMEKALNTPIRPQSKYFLPCGKLLRHHCKENNYNINAVMWQVKHYNLEPHEALAKYLENKQKKNNP